MSTYRTVLVIANSEKPTPDYEHQLQPDGSFTYRILTQQYGNLALELFRSQQIDGILLELPTADASYCPVIQELQHQIGDRCPPIIVIGHNDAETAVQACKNGAEDYLVQERITPETLRSTLQRAIANAELRQKRQQRQQQLQTSVETMLDCFGLFSAIRNPSGQIIDFRIDYLNTAACNHHQLSQEMQMGRGLCEVLPAYRESGLFDEYCRLVETGEPLIRDSLIYEDSQSQPLIQAFDIRATKLNDGFVASWRDVTERKRLELELRQTLTNLQQQQQRIQRLIDTVPIGIAISSANGEMRVINDTMLYLHGLTRAEFQQQGMNWRDFIPPELTQQADENIEQLRQYGSLPPQEMELLHPDGTRIPILLSATQWIDRVDEHLVFAVDLTQQKQAETAIQQLNRDLADRVTELQTLLDILPVGIAIATDPTCTQMQNNAYLRELLGVSPGHNISKSAPTDEQPPYRVFQKGQEIPTEDLPMQVAARLGVEVRDAEFDIVWPDGTVRQILSYATPLFDNQNQIRGTIGAFLDITERQQVEARYRTLFESMNEGFCIVEILFDADNQPLDYRFLEMNPLFEAQTGLKQAHGKTARQMLPDLEPYWFEIYGQVALTGEPVRFEQGSEVMNRWFEVSAFRTGEAESRKVAILFKDISDRKQVELERQRSEAILQSFITASPITLALFDRELRFLYANEALAKINELPLSEHLGRTLWEIVPQMAPQFAPMLLQIMETQEPVLNVEFSGEVRPGIFRSTIANHYPVCLPNGEVIGVGVAVMDVTDLTLAQQEIRESEERFRTLADNISQFAWMADEQGWLFWYNQRWFDYTGTTLEEMEGWGWQKVHHPDHVERVVEKFRDCIEKGETWEDTFPLRSHDGQYRWFLSRAVPVRDEQGRVLRWFGTNTDITDRQQAESALRQSEERYRCLAELIPQLVWTATTKGTLLDVNQRWTEFTGLSLEQARTSGWEPVVHPEDLAILAQKWGEAVQQGSHYQAEGRMRQANGVYRWHLHQAIPQKDEQGQIVKWFGTATDIEAQKQLEIQRASLLQREQAAREAAERANRIKDEFLAVLSHELRSPLNPILGWIQLLQTRKFDETTTTKALATIERNARLQTQLIDDLLDIAKILRGKLSLNITSVNLCFIIEAAIETVRAAATAKSISLQWVSQNIGQVSGDAARLQQIIWNLLSNAIKFTPNGGQVQIQIEQAGNQAKVTVQDTGKGISPSFLPYIFESFRQEDASTTRNYGGLGLGLAIVRQLVEAHGGTITADSPGEGLGSTFTLCLPLLNTEPERRQTYNLQQLDPDLTGIRVLAVDDDPDARELLMVLLTQYGAEVVTVASAVDVLAVLPSRKPDILISDIGMPQVDGYSLIQQVRALPAEQGGEIPAIALTAYAREDDYQRALASGYQQHLTKPLELEQLIQAIVAIAQSQKI